AGDRVTVDRGHKRFGERGNPLKEALDHRKELPYVPRPSLHQWNGNVHVWDPVKGSSLQTLQFPGDTIRDLDFAQEGRLLATAAAPSRGDEGFISAWRWPPDREELWRLKPPRAWNLTLRMCYHPKEASIAIITGSFGKESIEIIEVPTGKVI